jgi:methylisocitrate lyase
LSGKRLENIDTMCVKLKASAKSRADRSTVIIARTDARDVEGLEQAILRARRYVEAGADWIFAEALATKDEFRRFANAIQVPLVANMTEFGKTPILSFNELVEAGCRVVLYPVTLQRIAMKSMKSALKVLLDRGSQRDLISSMQTRQELYDLIGYHQYEERDRQLFS